MVPLILGNPHLQPLVLQGKTFRDLKGGWSLALGLGIYLGWLMVPACHNIGDEGPYSGVP